VYDKALSGLLCCHRIFAFPFSPSEALRGIESLCAVVRSSFRFDGYSSFTPSTSLTSNTTPSTFPTRFLTIHRATRRAREVVQTQERRVICGAVRSEEGSVRKRGEGGEDARRRAQVATSETVARLFERVWLACGTSRGRREAAVVVGNVSMRRKKGKERETHA
jgi:hypothetical protein